MIRQAARRRRRRVTLNRGEHGDRPRLDSGLPRRTDPLPEHARRPAVRALRRDELPRLRRARPATASMRGCVPPTCCRRRPSRRRSTSSPSTGRWRLRADLLAPHLREALRDVPERVARRRRGRRRPDQARGHRVGVDRDRDAGARPPAAARAPGPTTTRSRRWSLGTARTRSSCSPSTRSSTSPRADGSAGRRRSPAAS